MGILTENIVWLNKYAGAPDSMLELGNQFLYVFTKPYPEYPDKHMSAGIAPFPVAKPYFEERGYKHVSVDINGRDGAMPLDLSKPFDLGRTFRYITDFGTSEHVTNLYACLENLHRHAQVGTLLFHVNPLIGNWPGHGYWYRDEKFYEAFSKATGYALLDMKRAPSCGNSVDGWLIWALLRKEVDAPFIPEDVFKSIPVVRIDQSLPQL